VSVSLGVQCGHDAGCAVVRDGRLVAALQQERVTRRKHDGQEPLSRRLPIEATLTAAGVGIDDVDVIVTSFQAASPGGIGLVRPLVSPGFSQFDPSDPRHLVVSHHLAHAVCTWGLAGFEDSAVLVCDLAGSTTIDGEDYLLPFEQFARDTIKMPQAQAIHTECLSIYSIGPEGLELCERDTLIAHNQPDVFVQSAASLYDNASRVIFGTDHAHGQLMALASLEAPDGQPFASLVDVDDDAVRFRNDWQQQFGLGATFSEQVIFAHRVQAEMERVLLAHAHRVRRVTGCRSLAVAGGVFLNIPANTHISQEAGFDRYFVPSSPHDAGIAIGCAIVGWHRLIGETRPLQDRSDDRLGPRYAAARHRAAATELGPEAVRKTAADPKEIAQLLADGRIIARVHGRSEFGPRALGARSLLASPLSSRTKDRLNIIKGRQPWRPVAPIVQADRIGEFFTGPPSSPYMSFSHTVRPEFQEALGALAHPDHSTRAQTLTRTVDPFLYDVLVAFAEITGFPVLVNTSLNGRNEPIVETPEQAVAFFRGHDDVDMLLLEKLLIDRADMTSSANLQLAFDTMLALVRPNGAQRAVLLRGPESMELSESAHRVLSEAPAVSVEDQKPAVRQELITAFARGFLIEAATRNAPS
jgi:carbamoyltransferase